MRAIDFRRLWSWAGTVILAGSLTASLRAQDPDDQKRGVARVSVANGDVSVQRGDSGDWVAATINAPLMTGDRIATGANSRAEVQFDGANLLRVGGGAEVSITQLEYNRIQLALAHGTVTFRILRSSNEDIEVDTPSIAARPSKLGAYRIAVTDAGETEVTARSGELEVFSPTGSQWVRSGQMLMARGPANDPEFQIAHATPSDEWDRWNDSRDQALSRSASAQYVGPGVYGTEDLDPYGKWVDVPGYGNVWQPIVVDGWAPYRQGRWVWEDWYGWTWVSYEPWGWAPYHYGRWFYEPAYGWCWYPGAVRVRHYWSPALVAFFGFGGGGVSVGIGNVGWVPLAPYEVYHPWWGRGYYGGSTYINRSVTITNVNITNVYSNARVANGVTAVSGSDFRSGRFNSFVRVSGDQMRSAGELRGPLPIAPDRTHLQFSERQTAFVPRSTGSTTRFFSREQPSPAARVPFTQQQRAFDPAARTAPPAAAGLGTREAAPATRGWTRFGAPGAAASAEAPQVRQGFQSQPAPVQSRNELQNRPTFQGGTYTPPARQEYQRQPENRTPPPAGGGSRFGQPGRTESPRMSAPVVRDRPSGGGFSAPRNSGSGGGGGSRGNSGANGNRGGGHNR